MVTWTVSQCQGITWLIMAEDRKHLMVERKLGVCIKKKKYIRLCDVKRHCDFSLTLYFCLWRRHKVETRVWGNAAKSSPTYGSTVRDISAPWSTVKNRKETRACRVHASVSRHLWSAVLYCSWRQSLSAILLCSFSGANLSTLAGLSLCCTA